MKRNRTPRRIRNLGRWINDLRFLFAGGIGERASFFDSFADQAPIVQITVFEDIVEFFIRLGIGAELQSHVRRIENLPQPAGGQEISVMQECTYGFKVLPANRRYTVFASVWFFKNLNAPLDGTTLIGIAPAGLEALVEAKVKTTSGAIKATMTSDATFAVIPERGNSSAQSN